MVFGRQSWQTSAAQPPDTTNMPAAQVDELFSYRSPNVHAFKRSLVRQLVCEFRFPTLLELGGRVPPHAFVKALRKSYPTLELGNEVSFNVAGAGTTHFHVLRSSKRWAIALKPNSLALECQAYGGYADLRKRAEELLKPARELVDSDIWTRVGLRFINVASPSDGDPMNDGWVNHDLVGAFDNVDVSGLAEFGGRIGALKPPKGFLLQHQLQLQLVEGRTKPEYLIDIDCYQEEVQLRDTLDCLDSLHDLAFNIFDWSLGDTAREYLKGA